VRLISRNRIDFSDNYPQLLAILRESTPQDAVAPETLEEAPVRSLELLLSRWSVVRELVEAGRNDGGKCGMNQLALLTKFDKAALEAPLGEEGAQILEQLERITRLCTELKEFYKAQLAKDPRCAPGWALRPGALRRSLSDPAKVWARLSDVLSSDQFMVAEL
jgi:hypothetical protein